MGKEEGLRYNEGKPRYDLLHPFAKEQLARVFEMWAKKYSENNWQKGMAWSKVLASLHRHLEAIERGEDYDKESGILHAAHVEWNAHALCAYYKIYPQGDDRAHGYLKPKRIGLDVDDVIADFTGHLLDYLKKPNYVIQHWADPVVDKGFKEILALPKETARLFWLSMPPKVPASELTFEPAAYITARCIDPQWTQEWLDNNKFPKAPLVCTGNGATKSKVESAKELNLDVFVDDKFQNFVELTNAGIFTYLFDATYNRHHEVGHRRLMSLKDL